MTEDPVEGSWFEAGTKVPVKLQSLADETRCPICWGRIKCARVSMVCLHRYCASCIEQFLRTEMNGKQEGRECPVCRAHLHSRRATKPDPKFDIVIQALYGDAATYDEEEDRLLARDNQAFIKEQQKTMEELKARLDEGRKNYRPSKPPRVRSRSTNQTAASSQQAEGTPARKRSMVDVEDSSRPRPRSSLPRSGSKEKVKEELLEVSKKASLEPEEESRVAREKAESLLSRAASSTDAEPHSGMVLVQLQPKDAMFLGLTPLQCPFMLCPPQITARTLRTLLSQRLRTSAGRPVPFSSLQLSLSANLQASASLLPDPLPLELSMDILLRHLANPMTDLVLQYSLGTTL